MKKLKVILMGAGSRGKGYTDIMAGMPEKFEIVGVAEPIEERREYIKNKHGVEEKYCVDTWEKLLDMPKFADVAIIATMDRMHYEPAMRAIELGYDILLEKPVAPTRKECIEIAKAAEEKGVKIMVCHVLRYTTYYRALKNIIKSGMLGDIMSIEHTEGVGNTHQSHSFVRGNWSNEQESSFMLLQKCCHDMDILQWMLEKKPLKVQSFGVRSHFRKENAPEGAPDYCVQGCPHKDECYYNAVKLYYDDKNNSWFRGACTHMANPTDEDVMKAITETQYGKCVYKCNNNVVDHQSVNLMFEDGVLISFNMSAFNRGGRRSVIMGTKGELRTEMDSNTAKFYNFATRKTEDVDLNSITSDGTLVGGHGGGDTGIIVDLYKYVTGEISKEELSEIGISVKNHMIAFAAEEARLGNKVVDIDYDVI